MTRARRTRTLLAVILAAATLLLAPSATAATATPTVLRAEAVPDPLVTGPVSGGSGRPVTSSPVPLGPSGYVEQEWFLSGTATGYTQAGNWGSDGRWAVQPAEQAAYRTRILVRRPADPARFNGTVVVEWLDLPGAQDGVDLDPDFLYEHAELLRAGYAWVGVSAQEQGVSSLRSLDPDRYGTLNHPGDTFSYSIFSQATQALRHPRGGDPLGGLRPSAFIADGYSGSSARMVTYTNAIQPIDHLFNGVLIHSRWARSAPISQTPQAQQPAPPIVETRTDLRAPVLTVETESEILQTYSLHPMLNYYPATQADSRGFRLWEVPGTSHVDAGLDALLAKETGSPVTPCALPANDGQEEAVMDAALARLNRWVRTGTAAPRAPRIRVGADASAIARDGYGNALGGVRTPSLQAPTSTLTGAGNTGASPQCEIEGTTTPFTGAQLRALYPTHTAYVAAVTRAADRDVAAGFLLPLDAAELIWTADRTGAAPTVLPPGSGIVCAVCRD
ncbi:alpha/beta hydrolase domain-containing protein [Rugosimonospora africana]|nr:alpha/beta hydrolase domain-containing protein [Rugosimonospora africana]